MISRKSTLAIATAYSEQFSSAYKEQYVDRDTIYEYFYERSYEAWFCNAVRSLFRRRGLKDWFLQLHTGESLVKATKDWTWKQRQQLGQELLRNTAGDFIRFVEDQTPGRYGYADTKKNGDAIRANLELDGYVYRNGALFQDERDVLEVQEERGLLEDLYGDAELPHKEDAFTFLSLCEEHFLAKRWSDSIANARKFLELTLREACVKIAHKGHKQIDDKSLERPVEVRALLETLGLLEKRERETIEKVYGLLSHTGGHPYMAEQDQARLLRQLTLTLGQFVLIRLKGALGNAAGAA